VITAERLIKLSAIMITRERQRWPPPVLGRIRRRHIAERRRTQPAQGDADQAEHGDRAEERRPHRQRGIETVEATPEDGRDDGQRHTIANNSFRREGGNGSAEGTNDRSADEMPAQESAPSLFRGGTKGRARGAASRAGR